MAQLKDTIITGDLRVTDMIYGKHEGDPHHTYYVKGTQTGTTGAWTGNLPDVDALYEGLTIDYWLPYAGSGNATLNLTLKGGTTTGAINCYLYNTTRLTTHIPQYAICRLVYQTVNINGTNYSGWWIVKAQDNNDVGYNLKFNASKIVASNTIYRYQLLFTIDDDTITPLTSTNNTTGTSKTMLTNVEFDPYLRIYYYSSTTIIDANATVAFSAMYYQYCGFDLRYTLNCGQTLTTDKPFYLKVTLQSNGKAKIASDPCWAQSLPTTNDGYAYIYLGRTYSNYQLMLYPDHPVYAWDGSKYEDTRKIELNNKADTSSLGALAVKDTVDYATEVTNKPSTFTPSSHTHTVTTDTVGSASAGTAITADDITSWSTGTLPNLGTAIATDDITAWSTGTLPSMTVNGETLIVNFGTLPSLSYTEKSIPNVTSIGTLPSLSYTEKTIPNISVTNKTVVTEILVS